ncbi:MAG: tRNA (N(6)-L-threonylcarbamoyladenosine(37)-C(2))-methylthiotransferase MtaB [Erysipelotrichaceae bacterium]
MITFGIATLGCKVNAYESEGYVQGLLDYGYEQVDFKEPADIYIINTCAVTNTASAKSRQKINQAVKQNANALICVVGCYAQTNADDVLKMENVDLIVGTNGKNKLADQIKTALETKTYEANKKVSMVETNRTHNVFESLTLQKYQKQTRAFLKIQDGCNQFCSYCIIPYARGVERSMPLDQVVKQAQTLVDHGHLEIVLAGIHTGRYGHDLGIDLATLVQTLLNEVQGLKRIRISSIEIGEISEALLKLMQHDPRVAKHLHIPIQAANDKTLKAMNRRYTLAEFEERLSEIRNVVANLSVSTDLITGFPGESEEDFAQSVANLERIGFSFIHVFPYSKRDHTVAAQMGEHLTNEVKKQRAHVIGELSNATYHAFKTAMVGTTVSVIFETFKEGVLFGHSSEYLPVVAKGDRALLHTMQQVQLIAVEGANVVGTIWEEA